MLGKWLYLDDQTHSVSWVCPVEDSVVNIQGVEVMGYLSSAWDSE